MNEEDECGRNADPPEDQDLETFAEVFPEKCLGEFRRHQRHRGCSGEQNVETEQQAGDGKQSTQRDNE